MVKILYLGFLGLLGTCAAENVLIVADEIPAMEILAGHLKSGAGAECTIVKQDAMPADLAGYGAVMVYIHKTIEEPPEKAFIEYAKGGGKLILLHHSISSGKRKNRYWFPFLGIALPEKDFSEGGYKYFNPVTVEVVNLAPKHFITTHAVKYESTISYKGSQRPGFVLKDTEVYLNHEYSMPRTTLLGLKYKDEKTGVTYEQDTAGWIMEAGKGKVIYFMLGHSGQEYENPAYAQILVNGVKYR